LTAPAIPNSWIAPHVTELTFDRRNSVTQIAARPRQKKCCALEMPLKWVGNDTRLNIAGASMAETAVAGLNMKLVEVAMAYQRSRVLCAAARLGVADALKEGERSVQEIARWCAAETASLHRLLRTLAAMGVVAQSQPDRFILTNLGEHLIRDVANSAWPAVIFWADLLADNWSSLTECVRTGESAASLRPEIMKRWREESEGPAIFRAVMGTSPAESYQPIARSWDFSNARVVADLGGGGGAMIEAILATFPKARGILVDRPASIDAAKPRFSSGPLAERVQLVAADLSKEVPTGADVHVLKHVLHGYADDAAAQVLRNCRASLPFDGRILIVEFVLPDVIDRADPDLEKRLLSDLNMLAVTGGKERSTLEWRTLVARAGLRCNRVIPVSDDLVSVIECAPQ
jgi:predicted transcriptional regulator